MFAISEIFDVVYAFFTDQGRLLWGQNNPSDGERAHEKAETAMCASELFIHFGYEELERAL